MHKHAITLGLFFLLLLILSNGVPVSARGAPSHLAATSTQVINATPQPGDSDTVTGDLSAAFLFVGAFTCGSIFLLIAILWFLGKRRKVI